RPRPASEARTSAHTGTAYSFRRTSSSPGRQGSGSMYSLISSSSDGIRAASPRGLFWCPVERTSSLGTRSGRSIPDAPLSKPAHGLDEDRRLLSTPKDRSSSAREQGGQPVAGQRVAASHHTANHRLYINISAWYG